MFISPTPTPVWEFNAAQGATWRWTNCESSRLADFHPFALSVMGLFCLCFAGGFVAKLFDASLTWSDLNLKSGFNINTC